MSVLIVDNVSHSFGGRTILEDASFRLLKRGACRANRS